jgi:protein-L-isoaspartate O-methyltransferase
MSVRAIGFAAVLFASIATAEEAGQPPFITTPSDVVVRMLKLAGTGPQDLVVDLGSGDGRIVITAATEFGARGLGIELERPLVARSRDNARAAKVEDRVSFVQGDVLFADISQASVVTVYLLPFLINRLQPRLLDELRPGTRIVSHAFSMAGWNPDRTETMRIAERHRGQGDESTLFLWVVPAKARGVWTGSAQGEWRLRIQQNFQMIDVEADLDGRALPVKRAALSGREIVWEAQGARFKGRVEDGRMVGELERDGKTAPLELVKKR